MAQEKIGIGGYQKTRDPRIKRLGDVYHARFSMKGQRVQKSLETKNFSVAQRLVDDLQNTIHLGLNWKQDKELFSDAWPEFLEDKIKGRKTQAVRDTTFREYVNFGERFFLPFFGDCRLDELTDSKWDEYIAWTQEKSPGVKIFNHRKYLGAFIRWAQKRGKIRELPELYNPDKKDHDGVGKVYSMKEVAQIRKVSPMPFKLAVFMATKMGMRSSEITQLPKAQIDLEKRIIRLKSGDTKTGKGRSVPIHREVLQLLKDQIETSGDSPFLFPNRDDSERPMDKTGFKKVWTKVKDEVGVVGRFHDFRHTYLTRAFGNPKVPHLLICEAAGLSIQTAQKVYLHFSEEDLLAVADRFLG